MNDRNNQRYKLKKSITVYCPMKKAKVVVESSNLDEMDEFTKYLIYTLGAEYDIQDISSIIELSEYIVRQEVNYLTKSGLVESEEGRYFLTELGESYYRLICFVKEYENEIKGVVNCYNGIISSDNVELIEASYLDNCSKLKSKIIPELYLNKNVSNSKEFLLSALSSEIQQHLEEKEVEKLYAEVKLENGSYFRKVNIDSACSITEDDQFDKCDNIVLEHRILVFKLRMKMKKLNNYRTVLRTLELLNNFDSSLLSDVANRLLLDQEVEKSINENQKFYQVIKFTDSVINYSAEKKITEEIEIQCDIKNKAADETVSEVKKAKSYEVEVLQEELNRKCEKEKIKLDCKLEVYKKELSNIYNTAKSKDEEQRAIDKIKKEVYKLQEEYIKTTKYITKLIKS